MRNLFLMSLVSIILCSCVIIPQDLPKLYKQNILVVVSVYVEEVNSYFGEQEIKFNGSGFIADKKRGLVVTAAHVVKNNKFCQIKLWFGLKVLGTVQIIDKLNDIAIIKIDSKFIENRLVPNLKFDCNPIIGEQIFSIGNPGGFENIISFGILSRGLTHVDCFESSYSLGVYFSDIHGFGGSSGCPVFNLENKIVGMAVGQIGSYAIIVPAASIEKFIKDNASN